MIFFGIISVFICGVLVGHGVAQLNGFEIVAGLVIGVLIGFKTGWESHNG